MLLKVHLDRVRLSLNLLTTLNLSRLKVLKIMTKGIKQENKALFKRRRAAQL